MAGWLAGAGWRRPAVVSLRVEHALSANVTSNNVAAQSADPNSLLNFYKALIGLLMTEFPPPG